MTSVTLEEKRLRQLKQQLFGKEQPLPSQTPRYKLPNKSQLEDSKPHQTPTTLESINLRPDLTRIVILSAVAIAIQLSLFFADQNNLIQLFR